MKNTVTSGSRTGRKLRAFSYLQGAQVSGVTSRIQGGKEGEWEIWIDIHILFILCIIANICWIIEKAREFQKNIYFCFINYAKVFDCVDHNKLWEIPKQMGIPVHLTCLLINLNAGQEATVRTGNRTTE